MNQDNRNREPTRRTVPVEETTSNALVSQCDGFRYDWSDQSEEGLGYNDVPPPYTRNFMPPKFDLVYPSLVDFVDVSESVVEKPTVKTNEPETSRKENRALVIEDWVSDSDKENVPKVNTVKGTRVNTARPKAVLSAIEENKGNVVKASACWVWRPKHKVLDHGNPKQDFKDKWVIDSRCSRHMTRNISYLTNYEEIDRGFVAFGGNSKGGKITRKGIENLIDLRVKVIRCDNGTEFKNRVMNQFCEMKGIKREFSVARTPQQNGVAERKNRTLIEAARTMLADSKLPTTFWAEAVNTACYVQNRVLVIKPHNKTPYELFLGRKLALSFMRPFGCPVTILNTIDHLGKFDGKADEGFFVGYSTNSKAFRVFNSRTRIVEENLHVQFSENTLNIAGSGPNWLFDIDALTNSMNYKPVVAGNQSSGNAGTKACNDVGKARIETVPGKDYILLPMWLAHPLFSQDSKSSLDAGFKPSREEEKKECKDPGNESENAASEKDSEVLSTEEPRKDQKINQELDASINSTNNINTASDENNTNNVNDVSSTVNAARIEVNVVDPKISIELQMIQICLNWKT
ncbi:ribonuclease H-like domain-containing protein [Tanacetum coccineum]